MIFIYILTFLIIEINNQECNKAWPIYTNGSCQSTHCNENEFQNGDCIINNSIIKTQWLNKLFLFYHVTNIINAIEMPNNDIFIIGSECRPEKIYLYGLKSSGEVYFNDNEENIREIDVNINRIINTEFINSVGLIINNKLYILICETDYEDPDEGVISHCQIIDYENNHIYYEHLYKLLNYNNRNDFHIIGKIFTILNLNQQNQILLSYLEENVIDFH